MHIHAVQRGMDIACKMLKQLEESGVWEHVSHLSLGLVGEHWDDGGDFLKKQQPHRDIRVACEYPDEGLWEFPTLKAIQDYSIEHPGEQILYVHTKGTNTRGGQDVFQPVHQANWRRLNVHFLADRHEDCFDMLSEYVAVGTEFGYGVLPLHFRGNFWWARTEYLAKLYDLKCVEWCGDAKHHSETWVCSGSPFRCCALHHCDFDHQEKLYPLKNYQDCETEEWVRRNGKFINLRDSADDRGTGRQWEDDASQSPV